MNEKYHKSLITVFFIFISIIIPSISVSASSYEFRTSDEGGIYWYENDVRQGTYDDKMGIIGDGTIRGREIYDSASDGWYWLDSCLEGAMATGKEVWIPYVYQDELIANGGGYGRIAYGINNSERIRELSFLSNTSEAAMAEQVEFAIRNRTGKWVRYDEKGRMIKGWVKIDGVLGNYYPDQIGNVYYYDCQTGMMAKGYVFIGGLLYHFDESTGILDDSDSWIDPQNKPAEDSKYNSPSILENVINLTRDYDTDGYNLIQNELTNHGTYRLENWTSGYNNAARAADTCVHESFHAYVLDHYSYDYDWNNGYYIFSFGYYIDPSSMITIKEHSFFKTEEWASTISENLKTLRYSTYVAEGSDASANQSGIYGLINEFSAYCWGLNNQVQLYPYYRDIDDLVATDSQFKSAVINGTQAFTEFRFYILGYLNYAKEHHPEIYEECLNNQELINIYCIMERRFENLIKLSENLGVSYWTAEACTLYAETSKPQYLDIENEMFLRTTEYVLPSVVFNPQNSNMN